MKILFLIKFLLTSSCLMAQNISDLDNRKGFSDLTFDLDLNQLKKVTPLKEVKSSNKTDESTYMVKNPGNYNVYGYPVQAIYLSFYKKYLFQIEVRIKDITDMPQSVAIRWEIFKQVQAAYGKPSKVDTSYQTRAISKCQYSYWYGNSITLIQSIPYGDTSLYPTNDGTYRTMFTGDSWFFINNGYNAMRKKTTTGL